MRAARAGSDASDSLGSDALGSDPRDSLDATGQRVIDLTDSPNDEQDENDEDDQVAATAAPTVPIARPQTPEVVPIGSAASARARRWDGQFGHVALPAACVLLLLAVGSGVSAAVTGNPLAPVDGISRVVAKLPGIKDDNVDHVQGEIKAARRAVNTKNNEAAALHLDRARASLDSVSGADKSDLNKQISEVAGLVPTASATATAPGGGPVTTSAPSVPEVTATTEPTSPVEVDPTTEPPTQADPTTEPTTPADEPTADPPAAESTPVTEATGS